MIGYEHLVKALRYEEMLQRQYLNFARSPDNSPDVQAMFEELADHHFSKIRVIRQKVRQLTGKKH
ncbi:MAG: hypothetical protein ACOY9Y_07875 [Bacillota bacterium]